jgi:hypothetical protein
MIREDFVAACLLPGQKESFVFGTEGCISLRTTHTAVMDRDAAWKLRDIAVALSATLSLVGIASDVATVAGRLKGGETE